MCKYARLSGAPGRKKRIGETEKKTAPRFANSSVLPSFISSYFSFYRIFFFPVSPILRFLFCHLVRGTPLVAQTAIKADNSDIKLRSLFDLSLDGAALT